MGAGLFEQIKIYTRKNFRIFMTEKGWKKILFAAVIVLLICAVLGSEMFYFDMTTRSGLFAIISACIWIGVFNSVQCVCRERDIIKKEHRTGMHISAYIAAHLISQALLCVCEALTVLLISGLFLKYPKGMGLVAPVRAEYFVTYFLVIMASDALGIAISSMVPDNTKAMTVMPFVLIIQLVFSGTLFSLGPSVSWISDITVSKWGISASLTSANYNKLEIYERCVLRQQLYNFSDTEHLEERLSIGREFVNDIDDLAGANFRHTMEQSIGLGSGFFDKIPDSKGLVEEIIAAMYRPVFKSEYTYTAENLLLQWLILLIHIGIYSSFSIAALEFVDKDGR